MLAVSLGSLVIPAVIFASFFALIAAMILMSKNYIKVPPNKAAVISGRSHRLPDGSTVGYRVVSGGAAFKYPVLEKVDYLDLSVMSIPVAVKNAYTKEGVPVIVQAIANIKIGSDMTSVGAAAERFLEMTVPQIHEIVTQTLEAHLRSICGTLTVEEINNNRQSFAQRMMGEAAEDLRKMGLIIDVLAIQHIADERGYLEALGKKRTAEVKRDATIGEAEATRDAMQKSSAARQEGEIARNAAEVRIAEAEKGLGVQKAAYSSEVQAAQAKQAQAGPLAEAEARQGVVEQEVEVEKRRILKQTEVAEAEQVRKQKELIATVIRPAEAQREAAIVQAEASKRAQVLAAEGAREAVMAKAQAEKSRLEQEGLGEAAAIRAKGEAEAARIKAIGEAEGAAIMAKLMAEAEGLRKKADAYKQFNDSARFLTLIENLPGVIKELGPVMGQIAAPMANVDKVVMIDGGNSNGNGGPIQRFTGAVPGMLFDFIQKAQAMGLDVSGLLKKAGIEGTGGAPVEPPPPPRGKG